MKHYSKKGFTLVEILTGLVIFATISACSWVAVSTLFRSEQLSRNRTVAINLLQKSQEELRKASLSFFITPGLQTCQFPGPGVNGTCGLKILDSQFDGFTRSAVITPEHGSEIMRAVITVTWTDQGDTKFMNSAVLIAKPPDTMPGNILGIVRSKAAGNPLLDGVAITVTNIKTHMVVSQKALNVRNANYDFALPSGAFQLAPGDWTFQVKADGYKPYTGPGVVTVESDDTQRVDFMLEPKLEGTINLRIINAVTKQVLPNFAGGQVRILDDYRENPNPAHYWPADGVAAWTKKFTFDDNNPRDFSLNTAWAYRVGYAGKTDKSGPPNCTYQYMPHGWSSAIMLDEDSTLFACGSDYNGSQGTDRIRLEPGQTINVNVPVHPVPLATVEGFIRDERGNGLPGATIYARWPDNQSWWARHGTSNYITATSGANGWYSYQVPAAQEMFANDLSGAMTLRADIKIMVQHCCNQLGEEWQRIEKKVLNLFEGQTVRADITIPDPPQRQCGNLAGNITDGATGANISGATVTVHSQAEATVVGDYTFQCADPSAYRLPAAAAVFQVSKNEYYPYDNRGNNYYGLGPNANILAGPAQAPNYNAKLWPVGRGTVTVLVVEQGTITPVRGAVVELKPYDGTKPTQITDGSGQATFENIIETWPPPDLPVSNYYRHNSISHTVDVKDPSGFYKTRTGIPMPTLLKGNNPVFTIQLQPGTGA